MLTAITRAVSPAIVNCELTFIPRQPIDLASRARAAPRLRKASRKTRRSRRFSPRRARASRFHVRRRSRHRSRRARRHLSPGHRVAPSRSRFARPSHFPNFANSNTSRFPARSRVATSFASAASFSSALPNAATPKAFASSRPSSLRTTTKSSPSRHRLPASQVRRHPASAGNTLLANRAWFDPAPFSGYDWIDVDPAEPHAANALALGSTIIFPASFPRTRARIEARGFHVTPLDISELQKAESGLTCSSLIFRA